MSNRVMKTRIGQILADAIDTMNDGGKHWIQGDYYKLQQDGSHAYCSVGAIRRASREGIEAARINMNFEESARLCEAQDTAKRILADTIRHKTGKLSEDYEHDEGEIVLFNDAEGRTFAEVREVFELAIQQAESLFGDMKRVS